MKFVLSSAATVLVALSCLSSRTLAVPLPTSSSLGEGRVDSPNSPPHHPASTTPPPLTASENVEHFFVGGVDSVADTAKGALHAGLHPIETAAGAASATYHLRRTLNTAVNQAAEAFHDDPARFAGYTVGTAGLMLAPFGGAISESDAAAVASKTYGDVNAKIASGFKSTFGPGEVADMGAATSGATRQPFLHRVGDVGRKVGHGMGKVGGYVWTPFKWAGEGVGNAVGFTKNQIGNAAKLSGKAAYGLLEHIPGKPYSRYIVPGAKRFVVEPVQRLHKSGYDRHLATAAVVPLERNGARLEN